MRAWVEKNVGWNASYLIMCVSHVIGVTLKNQLFDCTRVVLDTDVASIGDCLVFSLYVDVSLFAGVIVSQLGCMGSQALGHVLMIVCVALLSLCVFVGAESSLQWLFYIVGVCVASFAEPIEATMMGPLVERTAQVLAAEAGDAYITVNSLRASLMATFAMIVSSAHIIVSVSTGAMLQALDRGRDPESRFAIKVLFPSLSSLIVMSLGMMAFAKEPRVADDKPVKTSLRREARTMCRLWRDPRIWLLGFAPMCLGLSSAFTLVALVPQANKHLGQGCTTYLLIIQYVSQVAFPKPISLLIRKTGADVWVGVGALNYLLALLLFFFANDLTSNWGISLWYVSLGLAWSIYEVVDMAVILDHFPKEQATYAFATLHVQMCSTSALTFFFGRRKTPEELAVVNVAAAACMFPAYVIAKYLKGRQDRSAEAEAEAEVSQSDLLSSTQYVCALGSPKTCSLRPTSAFFIAAPTPSLRIGDAHVHSVFVRERKAYYLDPSSQGRCGAGAVAKQLGPHK